MSSLLLIYRVLNSHLGGERHLLSILIESLAFYILSCIKRLWLEKWLTQVCWGLDWYEWLGVHLQVELRLTKRVCVVVVLLVQVLHVVWVLVRCFTWLTEGAFLLELVSLELILGLLEVWLHLLGIVVSRVILVVSRRLWLTAACCKCLTIRSWCEVKRLFRGWPLFLCWRWEAGWCLTTFINFVLFFKFPNFHLHESLLFCVHLLAVRVIRSFVDGGGFVRAVPLWRDYISIGER